jgi:TonB family protein
VAVDSAVPPYFFMKILFAYARAILALIGLMAATTAMLAADAADRPDQKIKLIKGVIPTYPYNMRNAGVIGQVVIEFVVDPEGRVINPIVIRSNNPWFERPAIEAILQWKYQPARKNGRTVKTLAQQRIDFTPPFKAGELWQATKAKDHEKFPEVFRWDVAPVPVMTTFPVYPGEALLAGRKGRAVVRFVVNQKGQVRVATVVEASAPEFAGAALAAVDAWRFKPATRAGQICAAMVEMTYEFNPSGDDSAPISFGTRDVVRELGRREPRILPLEKLDAVPKELSRRPPVYPSSLHEADQPGEALIEFYIDKNGDAQLPRVVSATAPEFGFAAAQAVSTWRYEPPLLNGKAVIARAQIPVQFTIHDAVKKEKAPEIPVVQP